MTDTSFDILAHRTYRALDLAIDALRTFQDALTERERESVTIRRLLARNGALTKVWSDLAEYVPETRTAPTIPPRSTRTPCPPTMNIDRSSPARLRSGENRAGAADRKRDGMDEKNVRRRLRLASHRTSAAPGYVRLPWFRGRWNRTLGKSTGETNGPGKAKQTHLDRSVIPAYRQVNSSIVQIGKPHPHIAQEGFLHADDDVQ